MEKKTTKLMISNQVGEKIPVDIARTQNAAMLNFGQIMDPFSVFPTAQFDNSIMNSSSERRAKQTTDAMEFIGLNKKQKREGFSIRPMTSPETLHSSTLISANLSLRNHRAQIYKQQLETQLDDESRRKSRIQNAMRFGKSYEANSHYKKPNEAEQDQVINIESQLKDYPKRFAIVSCLNNQRVYPANQAKNLEPDTRRPHKMTKREPKRLTVTQMNEKRGIFAGDYDKRAEWEQGPTVIKHDQATRIELEKENQLPVCEQRPLPRIDVDQPIPYIPNKEEEARLFSIRNHVKRRNPDVKLQFFAQESDIKSYYQPEANFETNQTVLPAHNPYHYFINRRDFQSTKVVNMKILQVNDRARVKTFFKNCLSKNIVVTGQRKHSFEGMIRDLRIEAEEVVSQRAYEKKFMSQTTKSSQIKGKAGAKVFDLAGKPQTAIIHHEPAADGWTRKPKVPIPYFVNSARFAKDNSYVARVNTAQVVVRVPKNKQQAEDEDWKQVVGDKKIQNSSYLAQPSRAHTPNHYFEKASITIQKTVSKMEELIKENRAKKIKLIEIENAKNLHNRTVGDVGRNFECKSEWQLEMERFADSIKQRSLEDIKEEGVKKAVEIDGEIIEYSQRVRSLMQWDRFGKGLNTQLEKLEIQTMMGQLNHEHDFLIKKLSELIEAIK